MQARIHGMTRDAAARANGAGKKHFYDMKFVGWKYNMSNIQAALLLPQIDRIEKNLKLREKVHRQYMRELSGVEGLEFPEQVPGARSALHLFTVRVAPKLRDRVLDRLEEAGIGVAVNFRPIHHMTFYKKTFGLKKGMFPNAERIGASVITLPFYPILRQNQIKYVASTLKNILETL